jgi:eukaryotic-like serine/threonine-protein kinase
LLTHATHTNVILSTKKNGEIPRLARDDGTAAPRGGTWDEARHSEHGHPQSRSLAALGMTVSLTDPLFLAFQSAVAGRYSLERELGRGGMGVVYLAREVRLDRLVAIKLLPPELAADDRLRDRFLREARTAARLSHPYIVPIHTVDEVGDFVFYVMAYVDGETLAQRVAARGPLAAADATRIMREVAWALAYAHAQGVVHRDVKPANILLERGTERAMVTDFGIARATQSSGETIVGELLGTPEYMSPEQASGEHVDGRSDLYALGAVGYFALTGKPPFTAPTTQAVLAQQITKPAPSVAANAVDIPGSLARVIDQCLEKDVERRPPTGEAMADALAPSLEQRAEVPVPVRVFLDQRRMAVVIVPITTAIPLAIGLINSALYQAAGSWKIAAAVALLAVGVLAPIAIVAGRLRSVLKHGYTVDDVATAIRASHKRRREEFLYEFGPERSWRERFVRGASIGTIAGTGVGIAAMIAGLGRPSFIGPFTVIAGYAGVVSMIFRQKWSRLRENKTSKWEKFWRSNWGERLAKLASFRLGQRAIPANRPTEMAIAMSAESLYASLPKPVRESVGDVTGVLHTLEGHAQAARARIAEMDATIAEAHHTARGASADERHGKLVADLRSERLKADERLSEVVTALENVRLDLLRLHAGTGNTSGITQDLAAARALGDDADRWIAGLREAEASLKR